MAQNLLSRLTFLFYFPLIYTQWNLNNNIDIATSHRSHQPNEQMSDSPLPERGKMGVKEIAESPFNIFSLDGFFLGKNALTVRSK